MKKIFSLLSKKIAVLAVLSFVLLAGVPFLDLPVGQNGLLGVAHVQAEETKLSAAEIQKNKDAIKAAQNVQEAAENALDGFKKKKASKTLTDPTEIAELNEKITAAEKTLDDANKALNKLQSNDSKEEIGEQIRKGLQATTDMKEKVAKFAALIVSLFTPIIAILAKVIGSLMGDEFIMGGNSAAGATISTLLYELWLVFRDIMNYIFILILLFIAFMTILSPIPGAGGDNYSLKTLLPKLIMAIVVINMTWFGARVVFDAVQLSTQIIFGLPQAIVQFEKSDITCKIEYEHKRIDGVCNPIFIDIDIDKGLEGNIASDEDLSSLKYVENAYLNEADTKEKVAAFEKSLQEKLQEAQTARAKVPANQTGFYDDQIRKYTSQLETLKDNPPKGVLDYGPLVIYWSDFNPDQFNEGTIAPLFAFSLLQIQNLPQIASEGMFGNEGAGWSTLLINSIMALVLMIIIIVLFAMMVINLFFRVIVLWANIIASPFMGLLMFKDELKIGAGENEYLGLAAFLKHAFAPAIMGFPMVIGFIMIVVSRQQSIDITGTAAFSGTPLVNNLSNIHQIFFYGLTIAVMWVGGVKAIEMTSAGFVKETFINPIADGVKGAAKFIAKAPMYITFIPVADGDGNDDTQGRMSLNNLLRAPGLISGDIEANDNARINQYLKRDSDIQTLQENHVKLYQPFNSITDKKAGFEELKKKEKTGNEILMSELEGIDKSLAREVLKAKGAGWDDLIRAWAEAAGEKGNPSVQRIINAKPKEFTTTASTATATAANSTKVTPKLDVAKANITTASTEAIAITMAKDALAEAKTNGNNDYDAIRTELANIRPALRQQIEAISDPV